MIYAAIDFIIENFEKITELDQFYKIHREHLSIILQSNRLYVSSELLLFNHVMRWVDIDRGERCIDMEEIFQHIRFGHFAMFSRFFTFRPHFFYLLDYVTGRSERFVKKKK